MRPTKTTWRAGKSYCIKKWWLSCLQLFLITSTSAVTERNYSLARATVAVIDGDGQSQEPQKSDLRKTVPSGRTTLGTSRLLRVEADAGGLVLGDDSSDVEAVLHKEGRATDSTGGETETARTSMSQEPEARRAGRQHRQTKTLEVEAQHDGPGQEAPQENLRKTRWSTAGGRHGAKTQVGTHWRGAHHGRRTQKAAGDGPPRASSLFASSSSSAPRQRISDLCTALSANAAAEKTSECFYGCEYAFRDCHGLLPEDYYPSNGTRTNACAPLSGRCASAMRGFGDHCGSDARPYLDDLAAIQSAAETNPELNNHCESEDANGGLGSVRNAQTVTTVCGHLAELCVPDCERTHRVCLGLGGGDVVARAAFFVPDSTEEGAPQPQAQDEQGAMNQGGSSDEEAVVYVAERLSDRQKCMMKSEECGAALDSLNTCGPLIRAELGMARDYVNSHGPSCIGISEKKLFAVGLLLCVLVVAVVYYLQPTTTSGNVHILDVGAVLEQAAPADFGTPHVVHAPLEGKARTTGFDPTSLYTDEPPVLRHSSEAAEVLEQGAGKGDDHVEVD